MTTISLCMIVKNEEERLVRRERGFLWREPVHEYLAVSGNVLRADIAVTHRKTRVTPSDRNLKIYRRILDGGGELTPRGLYYYARELKNHAQYSEAIRFFNRFLNGGAGWVEDNIAACNELAACYRQENRPREQLCALSRTFSYDTPRAETCCALGYAWKEAEDFKRAAFWFRLATMLEKPGDNWGFIQEDCWGFVPCIELAVCLDKLGLPQAAEQYNELAGRLKPFSAAVEHNWAYFQSLKSAGADTPRADPPAESGEA